jgi:hypothetical protein
LDSQQLLFAGLIKIRATPGFELRVVPGDLFQKRGGIELLDVERQNTRGTPVFHQVPFLFVGLSRGPCGFAEAEPVTNIEIPQFGILRERAFAT